MEFIIVTGMSGAGKSTAIKCFEDIGYYCIDNLPPGLLPNFIELVTDKVHQFKKIVLGIDIRGGMSFDEIFINLEGLKEYHHTVLFFECGDLELIKRFKETRRIHPLAKGKRIQDAIIKERGLLENMKQQANYIVDTTHILPKDVKELLVSMFEQNTEFMGLVITIIVFGFKYGVPIDADLVFDVRFLKNPFYEKHLRPYTGHAIEVREYVFSDANTEIFIKKLEDMVGFLAPLYTKEGKNQLVIGIGCTGGKHRSVVIANELEEYLKKQKYIVNVEFRDIEKDSKRGK
ncbi:RNase adapter RapZ [Candidatus Epulonipiscium viviparus]|uniref:RNase adapter RapZ n=1 Tax=Candidatus Epulonipiscium viviparus TaxID=420336 RepID=UPI002738110B|nr:RNase adapter RapZ [Candidatus Epulopiscium viviparus]